jgi:zinc/manganese transport system substrate-binding protein
MIMKRCLMGAALGAGLLLMAARPGWAALNVFACEPEWAALARELGREAVTVYTATTARQDPHQIEARPSLIARLRNAHLLVCTGAELEAGWLPVLLLQAANPRVQPGAPGHLEAARYVRLLEVPARVDRSHGDVHAQGNPHIHTDARNFLPIARELSRRMAEADPANKERYEANLRDFERRWREALARWEREAAPLKGVWVVVHHTSWVYLWDWLGMQEAGTLEPKPGIPPSAQHLNTLLGQLRARPARLVVRGPYDDARPSEFIAGRIGIPAVQLPGTVGGSGKATDLFTLFDDTIARLIQALTAGPFPAGTPGG